MHPLTESRDKARSRSRRMGLSARDAERRGFYFQVVREIFQRVEDTFTCSAIDSKGREIDRIFAPRARSNRAGLVNN